jgi:hypothetical protein
LRLARNQSPYRQLEPLGTGKRRRTKGLELVYLALRALLLRPIISPSAFLAGNEQVSHKYRYCYSDFNPYFHGKYESYAVRHFDFDSNGTDEDK